MPCLRGIKSMAAPLIYESRSYRHTVAAVLSKPYTRERSYFFLDLTTLHPRCIVSHCTQAAMHDNTFGAKHSTRPLRRNVAQAAHSCAEHFLRVFTVRHGFPSPVRLPFVTGCSQSLSPFGLELLWLIASR